MIRTICAVLLLTCTLPVAGDGAATPKGDGERPAIRLTPSAGPGDHLFFEGAEISLAANVPETGSENQHIRVVTYLANDRPVARSLKSPYAVKWRPRPGKYVLRARARYVDGSEALSDPMTVMVAKEWVWPGETVLVVRSPYNVERSDTPRETGLLTSVGCEVPGASSDPPLVIRSAEDPDPDWSVSTMGPFRAFSVRGDVPPDGAGLTLPIEHWDEHRPDSISIWRFDEASARWLALPTEIDLHSSELYPIATAVIDRPGIYTVGAESYCAKGMGSPTAVSRAVDREAPAEDLVKAERPDVHWILPREGATLSGRTEFLVTASDNIGVYKVDFYLDRVHLGGDSTVSDGKWGISADVSNLVSGVHTLEAVASDARGNTATATRDVVLRTDASAPQVTVNQAYYVSDGDVRLTGTVSDADGDDVGIAVALVEDGKVHFGWSGTVESDNTWVGYLPYVPAGPSTVVVQAEDEHGNITLVETQVSLPLRGAFLEMAPDQEEPQYEGATISFRATAFGGIGRLEYKFEVDSGTGWTVCRDYATDPSYVWTAGPPGVYAHRVTVREQGTTEPEFVSNETSFLVTVPLSGVTLSTRSLDDPQPVGTRITLYAEREGGISPEYKFEVFDGVEWSTICDFTVFKYKQWIPDAPGTYTLKVTAREQGTTSPVFTDELTYSITPSEGKDGER